MSIAPWLSVIMPTYNGAEYVREALDSICAQNDPDVECIVVDDGSSDNTIEIVQSYAGRIAIKLIAGRRRGNWVAGTNEGLRTAAGRYACFLHQDDHWLPGRLSEMKTLIREHQGCSMFVHAVEFRDSKDRPLGHWTSPLPAGRSVDGDLVLDRLIVQDFMAINAPVFDRQRALDLEGLDESLWYTADWDFWMRFVAGQQVIYSPRPLGVFRLHGQSQTAQGAINTERFGTQLTTVLERHLAGPRKFDRDVISRARLSAKFNLALATAYGQGMYRPLLRALLTLFLRGPLYWYRFLRDTRLVERVGSRLRALSHGSL